MKFRLLEVIRCPACRGVLRLDDPVFRRIGRAPGSTLAQCHGVCPFPEIVGLQRDCFACSAYEVMAGFLFCVGCHRRYAVNDGVPRLYNPDPKAQALAQVRTASSYGYLWRRSKVVRNAGEAVCYHFNQMEMSLSLPPAHGLILDAGCGDGIDLANQASRKGVEIVGVDLSDGGCRASFERSLAFSSAHVVQADICQLPFDDDLFDFAYSYGVIHHLPSPKRGLRELVRVLKPGACVGAYLYEDFSDRAVGWRWLLAVANQLRQITPQLPHHLLYFLCQAASPLIYALFTVPFLMLRRIRGLGSLVDSFPFRHATGPFSLVGDLYDRFSAPVEWRYNQTRVVALFQGVELQGVITVKNRGWMVSAIKSSQQRSCTR